MAETLTVALRVAEEAIDEAIAKAEGHTDSQVTYSAGWSCLKTVNILLTVWLTLLLFWLGQAERGKVSARPQRRAD